MTPRIKVYTRSFDLRLYRYSRSLYESLGVPMVRLTDQSADGYFYKMLEDTQCDIAINIDEDAFVVNPEAIMALVQKVIDEGYANAGCPDAAQGLPRSGDPAVTNPFFNVLNLSLIRTRFDRSRLTESVDDLEPYYPFFRWLSSEFKTLYLPIRVHSDGITTILQDESGHTLCMHSWFARFYSMPMWMVRNIQKGLATSQKERIDALISEVYALRGIHMPEWRLRDRLAFGLNYIVRWCIKVPQRISRWPHKIRRALLCRQR